MAAKTCVTHNNLQHPRGDSNSQSYQGNNFLPIIQKGNHADGRDIRCALEGVL